MSSYPPPNSSPLSNYSPQQQSPIKSNTPSDPSSPYNNNNGGNSTPNTPNSTGLRPRSLSQGILAIPSNVKKEVIDLMSSTRNRSNTRERILPHTTSSGNFNAEVETLKTEFERKIAAVVSCLQEKAEENLDLANKLKTVQQQAADKDRTVAHYANTLKVREEEYIKGKAGTDELIGELTRRIQTITLCLDEMAEDNLRLRKLIDAQQHQHHHQKHKDQQASAAPTTSVQKINTSQPQPQSPKPTTNNNTTTPSKPTTQQPTTPSATTTPPAATTITNEQFKEILSADDWLAKLKSAPTVIDNLTKPTILLILESISTKYTQQKTEFTNTTTQLQQEIQQLQQQIQQLEGVIKASEENIQEMKQTVEKEKGMTLSLRESIAEYEVKLTDLETKMWDNLEKEGQRRSTAEYEQKRLKKKVEELQFLLDELKEDEEDDDDDESDISDEDEKEKEKPTEEKKADSDGGGGGSGEVDTAKAEESSEKSEDR